ncbi:MAG: N-acetylmuramoyl-L-alanine amidase, partial [Lachnospiraceae bacterium]
WGHFYFGKKGDNFMVINQNQNFEPTHNTSARAGKPEYIVVHYVGALGDAKANIDYYNLITTVNASADFYVGFDGTVWQYNTDINNRYTWAVGKNWYDGKNGATLWGIANNNNCINIEMCVRSKTGKAVAANSKNWYFEDATVNATVELVKYLMNLYNIDVDHVVRHYDVCGKYCPGVFGWNAASGSEAEWTNFKARLSTTQQAQTIPSAQNNLPSTVPFTVKVLVSDLNYRSKPSMSGTVKGTTGKGTFDIIEISSDGWGKLKSGAGWIYLLNPTYVSILDASTPFKVKITDSALNIRTGPSINHSITGRITDMGVYTITEVKSGMGSTAGWGRLLSGAGWISLDFCDKI